MIKRLQDILPLQTILIAAICIAAIIVFQTQIDAESLRFTIDVAATRVPLRIAAILLSGLALWGLLTMLIAYSRRMEWVHWRTAIKHLNWRALGVSQALILLLIVKPDIVGFALADNGIQFIMALVPLIIALQVAAIFAPDDEPALEIQLAASRPISWLIVERLITVFVVYGIFTLVIGLGVILFQDVNSNLVSLTLLWLPPALFLAGFGLMMTMQTRLVTFGVIFLALVWMMFGIFGDYLLQGGMYPFPLNAIQPFLWVFNIFAMPDTFALSSDFWLNRMILISTGITFMMFAIWQVRDEETVLLNLAHRQRRKSAEKTPDMTSIKPIASAVVKVQATAVSVNPLWQIMGMGWYEFKMHWRRRSIKVFTITLVLINLFIVFVIAGEVATSLPDEVSELLLQQGQIANGLLLVMMGTATLFTIALFMFPLMVSEVVPLDEQYHVADMLNALPMNRITYLVGKILGVCLAGLSSFGVAVLILGLGWYWRTGVYDASYFIFEMSVAVLLMFLNSVLAVLLGATQPTRLRAIVVLIIVAVGTSILASVIDYKLTNTVFPNQTNVFIIFINGAIDGLSTSPPSMPNFSLLKDPIRAIWLGRVLQIFIVSALIAGWHIVQTLRQSSRKKA